MRLLSAGLLVVSWVLAAPALAQISPPGLGEARTAGWFAAGVRQELDARRQSMSYVGYGTVSGLHDDDMFGHPAILVVNEEVSDRFAKHWMYSVALSYRHQPDRQEIRFYGRYANILSAGRLKVTNTFRPELRTFYTPGFALNEEPLEFRFRYRTQLVVSLDKSEEHRLVGSAEVLASISKQQGASWRDFDYRESRFCLFYVVDPDDSAVAVDVGYMNDLIGKNGQVTDVHYLALDVTWENPFG